MRNSRPEKGFHVWNIKNVNTDPYHMQRHLNTRTNNGCPQRESTPGRQSTSTESHTT